MNNKQVSGEQKITLAARYGALILVQARIFVEDETKAVQVLHDIIPFIPALLGNSTNPKIQVAEILDQVRLTSIRLLRQDPHFDQWALWKSAPFHFDLLSDYTEPFYKKLFWYRYFRDIQAEEVAARLVIPAAQIQEIFKAMLVDVGNGIGRYVRQHP